MVIFFEFNQYGDVFWNRNRWDYDPCPQGIFFPGF